MKITIKKELYDEVSAQPHIGEEYSDTNYLECRFWGSSFIDCVWKDCTFKRTSFAHGVNFTNCRFINVKFQSPHTWIRAKYEKCEFIDCIFDSVTTHEAYFKDCVFSGEMRHLIFFGEKAPRRELQSHFTNVDLTKVQFSDTDFRMKVNLKKVSLPLQDEEGLFVEGEKYVE